MDADKYGESSRKWRCEGCDMQSSAEAEG